MTDIEQKAQALLLKAQGEYPNCDPYTAAVLVLEHAIEAHEATKQELSDFRQEVSDAVGHVLMNLGARHWAQNHLSHFIIPAPKPDPLVDAMADCGVDRFESWADQLRAALDARGLEIREKGQ